MFLSNTNSFKRLDARLAQKLQIHLIYTINILLYTSPTKIREKMVQSRYLWNLVLMVKS